MGKRYIYNCIIGKPSTNGDRAIWTGGTSGDVYVRNTILFNFNNHGIATTGSNNCTAHNVTAYNCNINFWEFQGTLTLKNCISQTAGTDNYMGTPQGDYNQSDVSDAQMPGANSITATVTFVNAGGGDFSLAEGSRGIDEGTGLSGDANLPVADDIAGTSRPQGASFDMGAFEFVPVEVNNETEIKNKNTVWKTWIKSH